MKSSGRIEFIDIVKRALNRKATAKRSLADIIHNQPDVEDSKLLERIAGRDKKSHIELMDKLIESAKAVNAVVIIVKDADSAAAAIKKIAADKSAEWGDEKLVVAWDHPLVKSLALRTHLEPSDIPVYFTDIQAGTADHQEALRKRAQGAFIGVTSADYCIAETATLVMKTRPGQLRCVSLLPSIHIAVIRLEQILTNLKELYTLLKWNPVEQTEGITRCMTFITGPSKTADIEATLIYGAHGPREMIILVLTG
jgi:L-lactate dehydrogenase complex protein LldG